jgi:hypothetical protein
MRIYGLDFTSNPSKSKRLTLAHCELDDDRLTVISLESLNTDTDGDFSKVIAWLNGKDSYKKNWIAGIDFPFSLPVAAVEHFHWLGINNTQNWESILTNVYASCPTLTQFQDKIESWKRKNKTNNLVKVHSVKRQTDQLAGSTVSTPLKVRDNPPVGSMFYAGAKLLQQSGASVYPVRVNDDKRRIVEAYPALVVNRLVGMRKYKDAAGAAKKQLAVATRCDICAQLDDCSFYGVKVSFQNDKDRQGCVEDPAGDKLDSVLCAVQAAWSATHSNGLPEFTIPPLREIVLLEGWITDPVLMEHFS